jgi:hypothetical protein
MAKAPKLVAKTVVTVFPLDRAETRVDRRSGAAAPRPVYKDALTVRGQLDFGEHLALNHPGSIGAREKTTGQLVVTVRAALVAAWVPQKGDKIVTGNNDQTLPSIWYVDEARPGGAERRSGKFSLYLCRLVDRAPERPSQS